VSHFAKVAEALSPSTLPPLRTLPAVILSPSFPGSIVLVALFLRFIFLPFIGFLTPDVPIAGVQHEMSTSHRPLTLSSSCFPDGLKVTNQVVELKAAMSQREEPALKIHGESSRLRDQV